MKNTWGFSLFSRPHSLKCTNNPTPFVYNLGVSGPVSADLTPSPRFPESYLHAGGYYEARPGDVIGASGLLFIDLRTEKELQECHIHGVVHCEAAMNGLPNVEKDQPIVVVCSNGWLSRKTAKALVNEHGFTEVYLLVGGMRRWLGEHRPVARVKTWKSHA